MKVVYDDEFGRRAGSMLSSNNLNAGTSALRGGARRQAYAARSSGLTGADNEGAGSSDMSTAGKVLIVPQADHRGTVEVHAYHDRIPADGQLCGVHPFMLND